MDFIRSTLYILRKSKVTFENPVMLPHLHDCLPTGGRELFPGSLPWPSEAQLVSTWGCAELDIYSESLPLWNGMPFLHINRISKGVSPSLEEACFLPMCCVLLLWRDPGVELKASS
jgi:hypothetical protein